MKLLYILVGIILPLMNSCFVGDHIQIKEPSSARPLSSTIFNNTVADTVNLGSVVINTNTFLYQVRFENSLSIPLTNCQTATFIAGDSDQFSVTDNCPTQIQSGVNNYCVALIYGNITSVGTKSTTLKKTCSNATFTFDISILGISDFATLSLKGSSSILNGYTNSQNAVVSFTGAPSSSNGYCLSENQSSSSCTFQSTLTSGTSTYTFSNATNETKTLFAFIRDNYNQVTPGISANVTIDTVAPIAPLTVDTSGTTSITSLNTISFTSGTDANGIVKTEYKNCSQSDCLTGCGNLLTTTDTTSANITLTDGTYYICFRHRDPAGNASSFRASTTSLLVDTVAPTAPSNISPLSSTPFQIQGYYQNFSPTYTLGIDTNLSHHLIKGCTDTNCSLNCTSPQTSSGSGAGVISNMSGDLYYYACVAAVDLAGNQSSYVSSGATLHSYRGKWTWMIAPLDWPSLDDFRGINYITSPYNITKPPPRYNHAMVADSSDNIYLYGGLSRFIFNANMSPYVPTQSNDFWKWNGATWTLISGGVGIDQNAVYGTLHQGSSTNNPGARQYHVIWADQNNHIWLFGGQGFGETGTTLGVMNDLWEWDGTNWIWHGGATTINPTASHYDYGTRLVTSSTNWPQHRFDMDAIYDPTHDHVYIYGGRNNTGVLSDLWRFDGTNWTWVSGRNTYNDAGIYNSYKTFDATNMPGARYQTGIGIDASSCIVVFHGRGYDASGASIQGLSDTFLYDISLDQWNWQNGPSIGNQIGNCGAQGDVSSAYYPSARQGGRNSCTSFAGGNVIWTNTCTDNSCSGLGSRTADLWKYEGGNWTFVRGNSTTNKPAGVWGTKGTFAAGNYPPSAVIETNIVCSNLSPNTLYQFFGVLAGPQVAGGQAYNHDAIWKFNGTDWAWIDGDKGQYLSESYGPLGVADASSSFGAGNLNRVPANYPGRGSSRTWIYGGYGANGSSDLSYRNALWSFDGSQFTYWGGGGGNHAANSNGNYGAIGDASTAYYPGGRQLGLIFEDSSGNVFHWGGYGYATGATAYRNDLMKFNPNDFTWTLIKGTTTGGNAGSYINQGNFDAGTYPAAKQMISSAFDASGNVWILGGQSSTTAVWNDLLVFNGVDFKWVSGSSSADPNGNWGASGVTVGSNMISGRTGSAMWFDTTGDLYVFGGYGRDSTNTNSNLNDMWKWDGTNWTWIGGSSTGNQVANLGTAGVTAPTNWPGGGYYNVLGVDASSNVYLVTGNAYNTTALGTVFMLWKWDGTNFTYLQGVTSFNTNGTVTFKGVPASSHIPSSGTGRFSNFWMDTTGDMWMIGGGGRGTFYNGSDSGKNPMIWRFTP